MPRINTKVATANATHAVATAQKAAPGADYRWRILKVSATYSTATVAGTLQIKSAATVLWELDFVGGVIEDFMQAGGLQCGPNEIASAVLTDGGAAIVGKVNLLVALDQ